jgi:MFS family permease
MFTGQLLYGLAVLILPQYARINGISQSSLGLLVGSYSAASLFVSPLLSFACTRFGRRNVLLCGLIGLAMSTVLFAVSSSVYWLALARIVQGVSAAANFTAGQAVLAHTFAGQALGSILGSAAGCVMAAALISAHRGVHRPYTHTGADGRVSASFWGLRSVVSCEFPAVLC